MAVAAGVLPALLFPAVTWLHMAGSIVSILLTATAVVLMRRPLSSQQWPLIAALAAFLCFRVSTLCRRHRFL